MSYMTFLIQFIRNVGSSPGQCVHISTQTNAKPFFYQLLI